MRPVHHEVAAPMLPGERRRDEPAVAEGEDDDRDRDCDVEEAVVVRSHDDDQERTDDRTESVAGVRDAESATASRVPRANEERDEREIDAPEAESEQEYRREEHRPVCDESAAPHAPSAVISNVADRTAAPVNRRIASQPIGTPKKAPTK